MNGDFENVGHSFFLSLSFSFLSLHCPLNYTVFSFFILFDPHMTDHTPHNISFFCVRSLEKMTVAEY